ncbi:MAG: LPS export ABC transporter periplasmic protein LptC [Bacteroidales bacterium]|nr:LPS export ABC transporter periplasmic protein LptC [Bacteroidales bacterium]
MENISVSRFKVIKNIAILFGVAMFFSCKGDLETIQAITKVDESPIETGFGVEMIYSTHANIQLIMKAPRMDRYAGNKNYLEMPEGISVVFYDSLMNVTSTLTANYAINYLNDDLFEARNDVVVVNEANEKLNTEQLIWDQKKGMIFSEKFVKITTEDEVLFGDGMESDERFTNWEIKYPRGTFSVETGSQGTRERPAGIQEPFPLQ